jgi:imidazolonepropionase-like amidohydrolase
VAGPEASLLIRNVTLIDGTGAPPRPGFSLLARDGRFASIVAAEPAQEPAAALTLDGHGLVAIPGLIDAHVHLSGSPWAQQVEQLRRALHGGVTAVWDLAGDCRSTGDLARAALTGEIEAPAIYYASLMAGPAFFTDPRVVASSAGFRPGDAPWAREITATTDIVRAVAEARGTGATSLKLYAALDAATVRRIADEAHRQGLRIVAHGTVFPAKPGDLVDAGVTMLAHAAYLVWEGSAPSTEFQKRAQGDFAGVPVDSPAIEHLLRAMHDKDVALNPTLWIFADGPAKDAVAAQRTPWMRAVTRRAHQIGVRIVAGTDNMVPESGGLPNLHRELEELVNGAGLTPLQALTAATSAAAHAMGLDAERGALAPGRVADVVLLEASPADDIRNTRRIAYVVKDGRIVYQASVRRSR